MMGVKIRPLFPSGKLRETHLSLLEATLHAAHNGQLRFRCVKSK